MLGLYEYFCSVDSVIYDMIAQISTYSQIL